MALGPQIALRQTQSLVMTPQLQQAIRLLQLSNLELEAAVAEEIARNPLLEQGGDDREPSPAGEEPAVTADSGADEAIAALGGHEDSPLDMDWREEASGTDSFADLGGPSSGPDEAFDFERVAACETSLCQHLLAQLHGASGEQARIAEAIVLDLDDAGYLPRPLREIAGELKVSEAAAEQALAMVQDLDPPGIGARTLAECLALQARAADRYDPAMARLIANLDLLARGRMDDLKRICGVDSQDLADMVRELRAYDPKPGCRFEGMGSGTPAEPDVFVRSIGGGYRVELNTATLPRLLVNRTYYDELRAGAKDKESRSWLGECLANAHWLTRALDQRARTIVRVVTEIVAKQKGFFDHGVEALKPLTLREVAEAIAMHESTVSRVTSNKVLLCERGLFELKYFFGSGIAATGAGDGSAAEAVKAQIAQLIAREEDVLSDEQIASLLQDQGMDIARRTVVKYREALGIGSSVQRRRQRKIAGVG